MVTDSSEESPPPSLSSSSEKNKKLDKDELFELLLLDLGGFGRFQWRLLFLSLIASILAAMNHLGPIYLAYTPKFRCLRHFSSNNSREVLGYQNVSWLLDSHLLNETFFDSVCPPKGDISECDEVAFDQSVMSRTIVTDFLLLCDRLPLLPAVASSYMAGVVVFNSISGFLSDNFGRRRVLLCLSLLHIVTSFLTAFSSYVGKYLFFAAARFFVGGSVHAAWTAIFVITAEVTIEKKRGLTGGILNAGWNVGSMLMTLLAFLLRDWASLQLAYAAASLLLIIYYFMVPESPRWLMQKGRKEEAIEVLLRIAEINGVNIQKYDPDSDDNGSAGLFHEHLRALTVKSDEDPLPDEKSREQKQQQQPRNRSLLDSIRRSFSSLLRFLGHAPFRQRLLLMSIPWFFVGMSSYGIHFSVKLVEFDIFILAVIKELAIIVFITILIPIYDRVYRTPMLFSLYLLFGLSGISFLLVPADDTLARTILFIICQGLCTANFFLVDTYTHEVFSTDTRNFAFALLDSFSKVGTTIAPFIVDLGGSVTPSLPPAVFGAFMGVAAFAFLLTPETKSAPLPQEMSDLRPLGSTKRMITMCRSKNQVE